MKTTLQVLGAVLFSAAILLPSTLPAANAKKPAPAPVKKKAAPKKPSRNEITNRVRKENPPPKLPIKTGGQVSFLLVSGATVRGKLEKVTPSGLKINDGIVTFLQKRDTITLKDRARFYKEDYELFVKKEVDRIMNPINEDLSLMRTTLAPQMIHAMGRNQKRGIFEGRIFEIGNAFIPKSLPLTEYPEERETLCIGAFGKEESFFTLKGMAEAVANVLNITFNYEKAEKPFLHPYQTAAIFCEGEEIGYLGKVKYEIMKEEAMREDAYVLEISMKALEKWYGKAKVFEPLPKFPEEKRDLALVMDKDITCGQVEGCIREACAYVKDVSLFDVYEGRQIAADKKSMAFTVLFTPKEEAFKADTVDGYVKKVLKQLNKTYGIELRS